MAATGAQMALMAVSVAPGAPRGSMRPSSLDRAQERAAAAVAEDLRHLAAWAGCLDRDDLLQEARIGLLRAARAGTCAYPFRVARNSAIGHLRRFLGRRRFSRAGVFGFEWVDTIDAHRGEAAGVDPFRVVPVALPPPAPSTDEVRVAEIVAGELAPREAQILRAFYWEDRSLTEIASNLGLSRARVSQIHKTTLRKVRARLMRVPLQ